MRQLIISFSGTSSFTNLGHASIIVRISAIIHTRHLEGLLDTYRLAYDTFTTENNNQFQLRLYPSCRVSLAICLKWWVYENEGDRIVMLPESELPSRTSKVC